jgi:leucyl/phenylalanyl-tRNA--protein transferase
MSEKLKVILRVARTFPDPFPDPRLFPPISEEGILAFGGDLSPELLLAAYRKGIFPWPIDDLPLPWFCPPERGILVFEEIHLTKSLRRARNQAASRLKFTLNQAFSEVIEACKLSPRPDQPGTWITDEMAHAYTELHRLGYAMSSEAWDGEKLVGGIYGVNVDGLFSGESMFHITPNASKLALLHLVEHLKNAGHEWIDIQVTTPHMESLGARLISRDDFLRKLAATQTRFASRVQGEKK